MPSENRVLHFRRFRPPSSYNIAKMPTPLRILHYEGWLFLVLLAATVVYRLLVRKISLEHLLLRKTSNTAVSPERVQLLIATLALAGRYIGEVVHSTNGNLPDISPDWLYVFGSSSGIYASVKAFTTLRARKL